jgi:hypothetical protein
MNWFEVWTVTARDSFIYHWAQEFRISPSATKPPRQALEREMLLVMVLLLAKVLHSSTIILISEVWRHRYTTLYNNDVGLRTDDKPICHDQEPLTDVRPGASTL